MINADPRTSRNGVAFLVVLVLSVLVLPGCWFCPDNTCQLNLTTCQAQLNDTVIQLIRTRAERDTMRGQFDQYRNDTDNTIDGLHHDLNTSALQTDYWRTIAENRSITVGVLQERVATLQEKKQDTKAAGWASLIIEILLGIAMIALDRSIGGLEHHLVHYRNRRNLVYAILFLAIIITVIILTITRSP